MMKKISSVILVVMMLLMSFASVPALAFSADDVTIMVNVYNITVTAISENAGTMTAKLTSTDGDTLYAMKSDRAPEEVMAGTTTKYKYEFSFRMGTSVPTGTYMITFGNNVDITQKTFPYVRLGDKIDFYNALDAKAAGEIKQFFAENSSTVPVDLTLYNSLDSEHSDVLALVNAKIVALNLATGVLDTDSDEEKAQKVSVIDELFTTTFAELMEVAAIASVGEENWGALMTSSLGTTFDRHFYDAEIAGTAVLLPSDVYDNFKKEASLVEELELVSYVKAFDKATLMEIEQTRSFGVLKDAFLYFVNKGIITPDMTDINALIASGADADLWKDLIDMENADCDTLVANAESIAEGLAGAGSGGGAGGGSVGGSSTPADKPTGSGGGGTLGGGAGGGSSSGVVKPVEPTPVVPEGTFSDIASVDWAKESIEALAAKGVINGKGDGKFAPDDKVTREEFVKIIIGAFDLLNEDAKADFGDVDATRWSYTFIATANELGIVSGDGASFNPTGAMSRQDMAVVIYRTAEKLGLKLDSDAESFTDAEDIADYAKNAIKALTANGIVNGMGDGTFAPKATVTRAQAAKVIYGLMVLVGGGK